MKPQCHKTTPLKIVGLCSTDFKARKAVHDHSFRNREDNQTSLSKHIWDLKDNNFLENRSGFDSLECSPSSTKLVEIIPVISSFSKFRAEASNSTMTIFKCTLKFPTSWGRKYKLNNGICTGRRGSNSILGEKKISQARI